MLVCTLKNGRRLAFHTCVGLADGSTPLATRSGSLLRRL
ncbi:hypothetical protein THTE_2601 [Thermogutta terrifontis]|uniref:Uncharacterized protein n=1 Tax=Thermogutta terrifontis TaxID=1331910 RepID=A0A286RGX4_9BACT|nr:hypothetical protein THTE_2601 [Thermogutta terrifontis]